MNKRNDILMDNVILENHIISEYYNFFNEIKC